MISDHKGCYIVEVFTDVREAPRGWASQNASGFSGHSHLDFIEPRKHHLHTKCLVDIYPHEASSLAAEYAKSVDAIYYKVCYVNRSNIDIPDLEGEVFMFNRGNFIVSGVKKRVIISDRLPHPMRKIFKIHYNSKYIDEKSNIKYRKMALADVA